MTKALAEKAQDSESSWPEMAPLQPGTALSEQIYAYMRAAIVTGAVRPELVIHEPTLAKRLEVSRTPIREALLRLRDDGLVVIKRQSGIFVAPVDPVRVEEAMIVRESLEPRMAAIAAQAITKRTLVDLEFETDSMAAANELGDQRTFVEADDRFHRIIVDATGFMHIAKITAQVSAQLDRIRHLSAAEPVCADAAIKEHQTIIKCLRSGNANQSEAVLLQHLQGSWISIRQLLNDA